MARFTILPSGQVSGIWWGLVASHTSAAGQTALVGGWPISAELGAHRELPQPVQTLSLALAPPAAVVPLVAAVELEKLQRSLGFPLGAGVGRLLRHGTH